MRDFELWIYHSRMQIIELKMHLNIQFKCHEYDVQWQCYDVFPMKWSKIRWHQTYANILLPTSINTSVIGRFLLLAIPYKWMLVSNAFTIRLNALGKSYSHFIWVARANAPHPPMVEVCENIISKIQHNIVNTVLFNKNWFKIIIIFCSTFRFTIIIILQMGK